MLGHPHRNETGKQMRLCRLLNSPARAPLWIGQTRLCYDGTSDYIPLCVCSFVCFSETKSQGYHVPQTVLILYVVECVLDIPGSPVLSSNVRNDRHSQTTTAATTATTTTPPAPHLILCGVGIGLRASCMLRAQQKASLLGEPSCLPQFNCY